jgi:DNA-binding NarL/FixJ family response regulator
MLAMIRIAVLEDNPILRDRILEILKGWNYAEAVHSAASNTEFLEVLSQYHIDLLLADLGLPDGSGVKSIREFQKINPAGVSIVISARSDSESVFAAIQNGAIGYLHKDDPSFEVIGSIKLALQGESPISPAIAERIIKAVQTQSYTPNGPIDPENSANEILTPREVEVLFVISKGLSYVEAAAALDISSKTLPVHVRKIYKKLHANNRAEAIYEARMLGILK